MKRDTYKCQKNNYYRISSFLSSLGLFWKHLTSQFHKIIRSLNIASTKNKYACSVFHRNTNFHRSFSCQNCLLKYLLLQNCIIITVSNVIILCSREYSFSFFFCAIQDVQSLTCDPESIIG